MYTLFKSVADVRVILPFMDDGQIQQATWMQTIGTSTSNVPIILLNLPLLFYSDKLDYSTEFSIFVKFLTINREGISFLVVANHVNAVKLSDFPFFKELFNLIPTQLMDVIHDIWIWNPSMRFKAFMAYAKLFVPSSSLKKIVYIKDEKQLKQIVSVPLRITIEKDLSISIVNESSLGYEQSNKIVKRTERFPNDVNHSEMDHDQDPKWVMPPLETQCNSHHISPFIQQSCSFIEHHALDTIGVFRQNGDIDASRRLMHAVIDGACLSDYVTQYHISCCDVCQSLKLYLKEIRLFPLFLYPYIENIQGMNDEKEIKDNVIIILRLLDKDHYCSLKCVVLLFSKVIDHAESNQMNLNNLLTCTILDLLPGRESERNEIAFRFGKRAKFMSYLIQNCETLFAIIDSIVE